MQDLSSKVPVTEDSPARGKSIFIFQRKNNIGGIIITSYEASSDKDDTSLLESDYTLHAVITPDKYALVTFTHYPEYGEFDTRLEPIDKENRHLQNAEVTPEPEKFSYVSGILGAEEKISLLMSYENIEVVVGRIDGFWPTTILQESLYIPHAELQESYEAYLADFD